MQLEIASHITISAKLFVELSVIVSSPPSTILHCETRLPLARMCRSQHHQGEGALQRGLPMQPKWIALGLFAAGLASLLIGGGLPYLKHLAIGLTSVLA